MNSAESILKKYWGYDSFRSHQKEIIETVISGKDALALLPTGGGKSICYQVPAVMQEGICVVVSPLIALMKDQVEQLNAIGIPAVAVYSGLTKKQVDIELDNAVYGKNKLLYVSPERLITPLFIERLKKMHINLLAVDEAHCISQWGYDFRPPYLQIASIHQYIPQTPVIALTATATSKVLEDISNKLQLRNPAKFKQSFERSNLRFIVREEEDKYRKMLDTLRKVNGPGIVYVRNRRKTQEIAEYLQRNNISADYYHAGLEISERAAKQDNWIKNKCRIIVCTNAFGMGINKPDVRIVLHWDIPESIEAYYQEAGRAGRDGKVAYAGLIYNTHDKVELDRTISDLQYDPAFIRQVYNQLGTYFQLAFGAGEGESFDLDISDFANNIKQKAAEIYKAIRVLEYNGYLYFNEPIDRISTVHFTVNHELLYRFQIENSAREPVIKMLLRMCPGILDAYVPIRESEIAFQLGYSRNDLVQSLDYLQKQQLLDYHPVSGKAQITYVKERMQPENLRIDTTLLQVLKQNHKDRIDSILRYVENKTECRVKNILQYFDEQYSRCDQCDICVERNKLNLEDKEFKRLYGWLKTTLTQKQITPEQLYAMDLPLRKEKFIELLLFMTDNKIVEHTKDNILKWRN